MLTLLSFFASCFQQSNSDTSDGVKVSAGQNETFVSAFNVLVTRCIDCHTGDHNDWAELTTETQWAGLSDITPGNSDNSLLVERIHGCGAIDTGNQMPKGAERLTADECKKITDWIDSLD